MSSRQEEKQRRREARLEREREEQAAKARSRRALFVLGGAASVLLVAVAVFAGVTVIGGGDEPAAAEGNVAGVPAQRTADLDEAVKAAGCKLENTPNEGAGHEEKTFKASDYQSNPPTSGAHYPTWYEDGVYGPGHTPELGKLVHTLEHGRVNIQYKRGTPVETTRRLEALVAEMEDGYHMLLHENGTAMPFAVAATAWDQRLGCPTMNERVFDALRAFRASYIDKGPEVVP
jgi:hypothetical protein